MKADYVLVRLNAQEQRELTTRMEKKQMKEFMNVSIVSTSFAQDKLFSLVSARGRIHD